MERLIEVRVFGNSVINRGAKRETEVQYDAPFGAILWDS